MTDLSARTIIEIYSEFIKNEIDFEVDGEGITLSLPFLYNGGHFIEIFIKELNANCFLISDLGNILIELRTSGLEVLHNPRRKKILSTILKRNGIGIDGLNLVATSTREGLGRLIHSFIEATKEISDLIYFRESRFPSQSALYDEIKGILEHKPVKFFEGAEAKVDGLLEKHSVDFIVENGYRSAIVALYGENTKMLAEVWNFRFSDIKNKNSSIKTISIYDIEESKWNDRSIRILKDKSDFSFSSDKVASLGSIF